MKSVIFFLITIGMFMIMHGIYEQKYQALQANKRVEYKFLPRTYYEEQITDTDVIGKYKTMFKGDPWLERNVTLPRPDKKNTSPKK